MPRQGAEESVMFGGFSYHVGITLRDIWHMCYDVAPAVAEVRRATCYGSDQDEAAAAAIHAVQIALHTCLKSRRAA